MPYLASVNGSICTINYYYPRGFKNVAIIQQTAYSLAGYPYYLVYFDNTIWHDSNLDTWGSNEPFYYLSFNTYEEALDYLFINNKATNYTISPTYAYGSITHVLTGSGVDYGSGMRMYSLSSMSADTAQSLEAAYYDWYFDNYGEYPGFRSETPDVGENEEEDTSGLLGNLWEEIKDFFGIVPEAFNTIIEFINNFLHPDIDFLAEINNKLAVKLEDNGFYTSLCRIERELTSIYNEDYTSRTGFAELGLTKMTLRRPSETITVDFGNEIIGSWEQNYKHMNVSDINYTENYQGL